MSFAKERASGQHEDPSGIVMQFRDTFGKDRPTSPELRLRLLQAMGLDEASAASLLPPPVLVVRPGETPRLATPADLILEDGTSVRVSESLPPDLPVGYHRLVDEGGERLVIRRPSTCWFRPGRKTWGWAVQLYAARSRRSWGIGDLGDLHWLARWSADRGAGVLLINPLGAVAPVEPIQPSPYFAGSRRFRSPLYLDVAAVAQEMNAGAEIQDLAEQAMALNRDRRIDRDRVFQLKMGALERLWKRAPALGPFEDFCGAAGESLQVFGRYCVLAEELGADWRKWPQAYQRPDSEAVRASSRANSERLRFHLWLQWLLDEQLRKVSAVSPLVNDLPIGVDPGGVDAWQWQDSLAADVTVGAPPDQFNSQGQDWALPPFIPLQLQATRFAPFIETIRAAFRHAGGLRIDHVMGLFRLFWIPKGLGPRNGAYVRYPSEELLAIVAVESERAGAWVAGEDLGTVEKVVRERLIENAMLSYKLTWFEDASPSDYPECSMAAITTHDLPTVAGLWTGTDLEDQRRIGLTPNEEGFRELRDRLTRVAGVQAGDSPETAVEQAYAALSRAGSAIAVANLDDAEVVAERTNMPGTTDQWPNWSMALPQPIEELESAPLANAISAVLSQRNA